MLTYGGLHIEAVVMWSRCCSHVEQMPQMSEADPTESRSDAYRTSS